MGGYTIDIDKVHDDAFKRVSSEIIEKCAKDVREHWDETVKEKIREAYKKRGSEWFGEMEGGPFWGISVRNRFRDVISPDSLGAIDWDDVYVPIIEYALGLRKIK